MRYIKSRKIVWPGDLKMNCVYSIISFAQPLVFTYKADSCCGVFALPGVPHPTNDPKEINGFRTSKRVKLLLTDSKYFTRRLSITKGEYTF